MAFMRQGAAATVGLVAMGLCKLVAAWAIARWQGPEVQGAFGLSLACISFGAIILCLGFDYANAYLVGRSPGDLQSVISNTVGVAVTALVFSPLWVIGFGLVMPGIWGSSSMSWMLLATLSLATALTVMTQSLQAATIGSQDVRGVAIINIVAGMTWFVVSLVAAQISYLALVTGWVLVLLSQTVLYLNRLKWARRTPAFHGAVMAAQVGYGVKTLPGSIARALNLRAGLYGTSLYLAREQVGIYALVLTIAESLLYLPTAFGQVVLAWSSRHPGRAQGFMPAYLLMALAGTAGVVTTLVAGDWLLLTLFGAEYVAGRITLVILLVATTIHAVGLIRLHHYLGRGRPSTVSAAQILTLVVTVGTMPLLVPRLGMAGAALSTAIAYTVFTASLFLGKSEPDSTVASGSTTGGS
ncbi:MAG: lipopolysaccharide biosynthesis protein [Gemmatimonadales bacterium]